MRWYLRPRTFFLAAVLAAILPIGYRFLAVFRPIYELAATGVAVDGQKIEPFSTTVRLLIQRDNPAFYLVVMAIALALVMIGVLRMVVMRAKAD